MRQAKHGLDEVSQLLASPEWRAPQVEVSTLLTSLDTTLYDLPEVDLAALVQISDLNTTANRMLATVERALASVK